MSRVLPNAMAGRAFEELGVENQTLAADLPTMVELGLQKLYGFQHNGGGWGWRRRVMPDMPLTMVLMKGSGLAGMWDHE